MGQKRGKKAGKKKQGKAKPAAAAAANDDKKSTGVTLNSIQHGEDAFSMKFNINDISVTGVLTSQEDSRDIKVEQHTLLYCGHQLLEDATIELNYGNKYGLIGANGCGKSTLLRVLAAGELPVPNWIDVHLLQSEVDPSELSALESVLLQTRKEITRLEELQMDLLELDPDSPKLTYIDDRLEELDGDTLEPRAAALLKGLGFSLVMQSRATKDLSGGWRMRVALAKALFARPHLLLLDDPTNHLDLETCVWLEDYLSTYPHILVIVSHSQDFLNNVCTHTIHFQSQKLTYYGGSYDTFIKTKSEMDTNQTKAYKKQQAEIKHMKQFISSCGTFSNLVRQAKSRQKIIDKMEADGLIQMPVKDSHWAFEFPDCEKLPPPVLSFTDVKFGYSPDEVLYQDVNLGIDCDSRVAIVGRNGTGKTTLLKLMCDKLQPLDGTVNRHPHLKFGRYEQHLAHVLPMEKTVLEYCLEKYSDRRIELEDWRKIIGRAGLSGKQQMTPIGHLSDGQRSRVVFLTIYLEPGVNMLLLDEPTNGLSIECIDSLADAINKFNGGMVLVSHDFRLIDQVAKQVIEVADNEVRVYKGSIQEYKSALKKVLEAEHQEFEDSYQRRGH